MDDGLSEPARRLIALAMAQDAPAPGAQEQSWGMLISRVEIGGTDPSDADDLAQRATLMAPAGHRHVPLAPVVGERIGRFIVVDVLGQGAMGVVVRAFDPRLERTLAIKVVGSRRTERAERARARLVAEARALARLSHPNVVAVYEVDVHEGRDYVAMELVDGVDLQRWLRAEPRSWQEIVRVFAAAADGLHAVHQAGLLHRDIKPANILMGSDGRVRVGDFGIATRGAASTDGGSPPDMRAFSAADDLAATDTPASELTSLTDDGEVVGTPAYMAPEQHVGSTLTAAADQYAFCVSLFEALWGERPFVVPTLLLAQAKRTPPVRPPRAGVPAWLFRAVARGLAPDPAQRFASMAELAAALRRDPGRRRRRVAFVVATLAGIGAGALLTAGPGPCDGADAKLEGIWDAPARAAIEQAFTASDRPYAAATWTQVSSQLDGYAAAWRAMHTDACLATRVRAEQSEALLDRRMLCLEIRRAGLAATTQLLRAGDADTVDHAFAMVGRLRSVAPCGDAEALAAQVPPPDDPQVRAHVEATRADVARARASYDAGRYDEALLLADAAAETAKTIGYEPLVAEAHAVRGDVLQTRGRHDESREALHLAVWTALGVGHDAVAVEAAASAVWLEAEYLRDFDAAAQWAEIARATLRRTGSPPSVAARVGNVVGVSLANAGRYDDALAEYEHALALVADDPSETYIAHGLRTNIGNVYVARGDGARAREIYASELAGFEALLGPDHPRVNLLRRMLADALGDAGEHARAVGVLEGVVASVARVYGDGASELGSAHMSLATAYLRVDRGAEALALYERARDTFAAAGDRVSLALALGNLGSVQFELGNHAAALEALDGALAIQREIYGGDHGDMVYPLVDQAGIAVADGRFADAERIAAEAERIATAVLDPLAHERIIAMQTRETALAAQGRIAEALPLARETLALAERSEDIRPGTRPTARAHLGMLLAQTGENAEALAVLERAAVELAALGDRRESLELRLARAGALAALGRRDEARAAAREGIAEARREGWQELVERAEALLDGPD